MLSQGHAWFGLLMAGVGTICLSIEVFGVLRYRLRNPFFQLRPWYKPATEAATELEGWLSRIESLHDALQDRAGELQSVYAHNQNVRPPFTPIGRETVNLEETELQRREREMIQLLDEFRGYFYSARA